MKLYFYYESLLLLLKSIEADRKLCGVDRGALAFTTAKAASRCSRSRPPPSRSWRNSDDALGNLSGFPVRHTTDFQRVGWRPQQASNAGASVGCEVEMMFPPWEGQQGGGSQPAVTKRLRTYVAFYLCQCRKDLLAAQAAAACDAGATRVGACESSRRSASQAAPLRALPQASEPQAPKTAYLLQTEGLEVTDLRAAA